MAFQVKKMLFSAEVAIGNKAYSGVGFQGKALILWATQATVDGFTPAMGIGIGFAISSSSRCSVATAADDGVTPSNVGRAASTTRCLIVQSNGVPTTALSVDFVSWSADGFTLNYATATPNPGYLIHALVLGGDDLTNVYIGNWTNPASGGSFPVTGVGFKPDALVTIPSSLNTGMAFVTPTASGLYTERNADNVNPTQSEQYQTSSYSHAVLETGSIMGSRASLTSMDSDGFTLNYDTVLVSGAIAYFLALKGGRYAVVSDTQKTSTGTKTNTAVGFQPSGMLSFSGNAAANASIDGTLQKFTIGGTDGTNEGCTWVQDVDNVATTQNAQASVNNKFLRMATADSTTNAECDASFSTSGFTLDWTTADATDREFYAMAFGSIDQGTTDIMLPLGRLGSNSALYRGR